MYILNVAIDVPLYKLFSYNHVSKLAIGTRVKVHFATKEVVGFVLGYEQDNALHNLKPILEVYPEILDSEVLQLIRFCSQYYHYPIGQTVMQAVPKYYRQTEIINYKFKQPRNVIVGENIVNVVILNKEQQYIVNNISQHFNEFYPSLLYGITGSGKTEVYMELIYNCLLNDQQALVMVPEINLTPQLLERFINRFPTVNIKIMTSQVTNRERLKAYVEAEAGEANIIIGTRLSIFTPFKNLGLIIVDEEHDLSFKQNDNLRYHARDLAVFRARIANCPLVLGSATPSIETLYNYQQGKYHYYKLSNRANTNAVLPTIKIVDTNIYSDKAGLTSVALEMLNECLKNNELSLVFINRRGYAPIVCCNDCGYVVTCANCSVNMVYHSVTRDLKCHHCGVSNDIPKYCPQCNSTNLSAVGLGTQKIEELLKKQLPHARVYRIDQDTLVSKKSWIELYKKINNHEIDILIGTQILAKGHDFANLTLVICLAIDNGLYSHDFRSSEYLYAQLTQVSGRAGRSDKKGTVLLQTSNPNHPIYHYLFNNDFNGFVNEILAKRYVLQLPPYTYYAMLRVSGKSMNKVMDCLYQVAAIHVNDKDIVVYPPLPAIIQRLKNKERGQLLITSINRDKLHRYIDLIQFQLQHKIKPKQVSWLIDVDPFEL